MSEAGNDVGGARGRGSVSAEIDKGFADPSRLRLAYGLDSRLKDGSRR